MFLVKLLALACIFALAADSKRVPEAAIKIWTQLTAPYHELCLEESKADPKVMTEMLDLGYIPESEEIGCYLKCLYEKLSIMKPDGQFDTQHMADLKKEYLTMGDSEKCVNAASSENSRCKKSFLLGNCIVTTLAA